MSNRENTKKILKISTILLGVLIVLGYALFASHNFILGPRIIILKPETGSTVATSTIIVEGIAKRIRDISLNGRPILIDKEGNFNETLLLAPGYNVSLLQAQDKFNRTIEYKIELVYLK